MAGLVLEPLEVASPVRWRWLLRTEEGTALATNEVDLPTGDDEYEGFVGLYRFLRWHADPGRRVASEAEQARRVGEWMGRNALGEEVMTALLAEAPVTVRMPVPPELAFLPYRPWPLASVNGQTLGREQVSFVFDLPDARPRARHAAATDDARPVRVLAIFSLPEGGSALALRRERYALQQMVTELGHGQSPRAVQLWVLQYGVTRRAIEDALDEGDGWDVLHLSGHGAAGTLLLEDQDGGPDPISSQDLVELVFPARHRLRLVVLSACESGAATTAETLHQLNLPEQAAALDAQAQDEADSASAGSVDAAAAAGDQPLPGWPGMARALVTRVGCAVLAMRYPVVDEFAIALTDGFYRRLFDRDQPVDQALARALRDAVGEAPSLAAPAVSLATPALLGPAAGLTLTPPPGPVGQVSVGMAGFPAEPGRFVGRTGVLARARQALAAGSGQVGVCLHGIAGAGKTTAALELAYQTGHTFSAAVWWTAPPADQWQTGLDRLARELETRLNPALTRDDPRAVTVRLVDKLASADRLEAYLPELTELVERARLLIVLDNLETLLSATGDWKDPAFGQLVAALTSHAGSSRVVLTARIVPAGVDQAKLTVLPLHTLRRDEALLLARELPHLRALQHDALPATRNQPAQVNADRALLARTLAVVQGHPKLLELADAAAANPAELERRVAAAETAAAQAGTPVTAFLDTGNSLADDNQLLDALTNWTRTSAMALSDESLLLLQLLACAEPEDRDSLMLRANWSDVWHRLGRLGEPPAPEVVLDPLIAGALIDTELFNADDPAGPITFRLHPGIAETIRTETPPEVRAAVDTELAAYWASMVRRGLTDEQTEGTGRLVVHGALAAAPYLIRLGAWEDASRLLEVALTRDESPTANAALLPHLRAIAEANAGTERELIHRGVLARALVAAVDDAQAETLLNELLEQANAQKEYRAAAGLASELINVLLRAGRYPQALQAVDRLAEFNQLAGLGPWTQLASAGRRMQILLLTGDPAEVLAQVQQLRARMAELPDPPTGDEAIEPWNIREALLDTGRGAAAALGKWQDALDLNAESLASKQRRGADAYELARYNFNDYAPLLRLGRVRDADQLLRVCQQASEASGDIRMLGKVFAARAEVARSESHLDTAVYFQTNALRYLYVHGEPTDIAFGHHNFANYQLLQNSPPVIWLGHRLAAAILLTVTGAVRQLSSLSHLARELTDPDAAMALPTTVDQVRHVVEQIDGVHFSALLDALLPDPIEQQALLDLVVQQARELPVEEIYAEEVNRLVTQWEPRLGLIVAAIAGDDAARGTIDQVLESLVGDEDWDALVAVLRRIIAGERDADSLLAGLDVFDTAIVTRLLDALAGRVELDVTVGNTTSNGEIDDQP